MASLEDNLNQLLSDPNAMEQIFSLAGKLGMSSEPSGEPEAEEQPLSEREPEAAELSQPLFGAEGLGGLGKLLEIFQGSQQTAQEADALLDNAYIPGGEPYETIPEDHDPPGFHHLFEKEGSAISGLLKKLGLHKLDSGDLLLLLLLFLLWREGDSFDWVLLAALALLFLRDGDS